MNPAAARLLLASGPSAYRRLSGIVAGVALGTGMLLILLGGFLHMPDRDDRIAWRTYGGEGLNYTGSEAQIPAPTPQTALRDTATDYFLGGTYTIVSVAASADTLLTMPDGSSLPGPGEYYASPTMARLIAAHPADQLGERFGTPQGELSTELLKGPSDKVVLVGADWDQLGQASETELVTGFPASGTKLTAGTYRFVLAVGSIAVLIPIVLLISIVSQLGASERRERLATVRLIGAGRRAIAGLSGLEMLVATFAGAVLGIGAAAAMRPLAATLVLNGSTSFIADLTPPVGWTAIAVIAIAVLGGATAWWRTFRDDVGALGATRERAEKRVTAWRSLTLVIGLAMLGGPAIMMYYDKSTDELFLLVMMLGFAMTAFGIVVAGPWLTHITARLVGRFARSAPSVVAAGRLARHSRATFRSVAGLVIAVFIVSLFAGVVSALLLGATARDEPGRLAMNAVMVDVVNDAQVESVTAATAGLQGVGRAVVAYEDPDNWHELMRAEDAVAIGALPGPGTEIVSVNLYEMLAGDFMSIGTSAPVPEATDASIEGADPARVIVLTDGSPEAKERARTAIEKAIHPGLSPLTRTDYSTAGAVQVTHELGTMAYLGMAIAIGISALSLTVATVAAVLDRKRTFALLRLGGMPSGDLRRVIATEATVPLAATLLLSAGLGFLVAWMFIAAVGDGATMAWPDSRYWAAITASVAIAVAAVFGSFGMARRSTEVTTTRFE